MKISDLDFIYQRYHFLESKRSEYLECAKKCNKDYHFSLSLDGNFLCNLESVDDVWIVSFYIRNVIFELVFEFDSYLRSFCSQYDLDYSSITYEPYISWLSSRYQSK